MTTDDMVFRVLEEIGPSLSSEVARQMTDKFALTPVAARKRIERSKNERHVFALEQLRFKHNEQFLFTESQRATSTFVKSLLDALQESKSAYRLPIQGVSARGGLVPKFLFPMVSGLPAASAKSTTAEGAFIALSEFQLLESIETQAGTCIRLGPDLANKHISPRRLLARLAVENIFLLAFRDWLRLQGFITAEKSSIRGDEQPPQFGFFAWDFVAPSYVNSMMGFFSADRQPGFVVADVILGRRLTADDVQFFVAKCNASKSKGNNRPFLPFLIADWFEKDALLLGRRHGLIFTTPKNFFGSSFATMLDTIEQVFENKQELFSSSRDVWNSIVEAGKMMQHLEVAFGELKAVLFELIVGTCLSALYSTNVEYGQTIKDWESSRQIDVDILVLQPNKTIMAAECKYVDGPVDIEIVRNWFLSAPSIIKSHFSQDRWYSNALCHFSFWTSGVIDTQTRSLISSLQTNNVQYSVFDRSDIQKVLMDKQQTKLSEIFEQWYTYEPHKH